MNKTHPRSTRTPIGEANGNARLTHGNVAEAKRLRATGQTYVEIAARYGVSESTVRRAITGQSWIGKCPRPDRWTARE